MWFPGVVGGAEPDRGVCEVDNQGDATCLFEKELRADFVIAGINETNLDDGVPGRQRSSVASVTKSTGERDRPPESPTQLWARRIGPAHDLNLILLSCPTTL